MSFTPRLTEPTSFGTYYTERRIPVSPAGTETGWQYFYSGDYTYTNTGAHTGNCTWYAMGRSAEIAERNLYSQFAGSYEAYDWNSIWIGNPAQTSGAIDYQPGDILVYSNNNPDPDSRTGHVEIVEEINGNRLTISYSAYSIYTPQTTYGTFFGVRCRNKMTFGDTPSIAEDSESYFTRNNGDTYPLTSEYLIGVIHNPYYEPPEPPSIKAWLIGRALQKRRKRFNVLFR